MRHPQGRIFLDEGDGQGKEVTWAPTNADGRFSGMDITLKQAFAMSINSVAVRLGQEVGIDRIVQTAHEMGIKSKLDPTPSLTLGASDVNLLELVNAYCTPVNDGKHQTCSGDTHSWTVTATRSIAKPRRSARPCLTGVPSWFSSC